MGRMIMRKVIPINSRKPARIAEIVNVIHAGDQVVIWTQFDEESEILGRLIPDAAVISGKTKQTARIEALENLRTGKIRVLITKVRLFGTGLNLQHLSVCVFSYSNDSFEQFYQADKQVRGSAPLAGGGDVTRRPDQRNPT